MRDVHVGCSSPGDDCGRHEAATPVRATVAGADSAPGGGAAASPTAAAAPAAAATAAATAATADVRPRCIVDHLLTPIPEVLQGVPAKCDVCDDPEEKGAVPVPWMCRECEPDAPPRYCGVCALRKNWSVGDGSGLQY